MKTALIAVYFLFKCSLFTNDFNRLNFTKLTTCTLVSAFVNLLEDLVCKIRNCIISYIVHNVCGKGAKLITQTEQFINAPTVTS